MDEFVSVIMNGFNENTPRRRSRRLQQSEPTFEQPQDNVLTTLSTQNTNPDTENENENLLDLEITSNELPTIEVIQECSNLENSSLITDAELENTLNDMVMCIELPTQSSSSVGNFIKQSCPLFQKNIIEPFGNLLCNPNLTEGQVIHAMWEQANIAAQFHQLLCNVHRINSWYPQDSWFPN